MDVTLQKLGPSDAPRLHALAVGYFQEIAPQLQIDAGLAVARHLGDPMRRNWLILADGEIAGFAFTFPVVPDLWEIAEFFIVPGWRRRTLGLQALERILSRQPGAWRLGIATDASTGRYFWRDSLARLACVSQLKPGPALMPAQSSSFSFLVSGDQLDD